MAMSNLLKGLFIPQREPNNKKRYRFQIESQRLKHFDTLFYSSEEHFISDNLNKVSSCFKIVKDPPAQSLLQIISPRLRLCDINL